MLIVAEVLLTMTNTDYDWSADYDWKADYDWDADCDWDADLKYWQWQKYWVRCWQKYWPVRCWLWLNRAPHFSDSGVDSPLVLQFIRVYLPSSKHSKLVGGWGTNNTHAPPCPHTVHACSQDWNIELDHEPEWRLTFVQTAVHCCAVFFID